LPTDAELMPVPSWTLAIRMRKLEMVSADEEGRGGGGKKSEESRYQRESAVLRGSVFAVRKSYLAKVGGLFDEGLVTEDGVGGGGEYLELSLRAWLCGGNIKQAKCSHVGVLSLSDPVTVTSAQNIRRIAEKWFGSRKNLVYRITGVSASNMTVPWDEIQLSPNRRSTGSASLSLTGDYANGITESCKDIDWYMENVGKGSFYGPSTLNPEQFGVLQVDTGRCAHVARDSRIELDACDVDNRVQPDTTFELTSDGRLLSASGKCLTAITTAYVQAEECRPNDDHQKWRYQGDQELFNVWSKYCATHVTDPDSAQQGRQVMMAQHCQMTDPKQNIFRRWRFITV
jgi:hypothetical protein